MIDPMKTHSLLKIALLILIVKFRGLQETWAKSFLSNDRSVGENDLNGLGNDNEK